MCRVGKNLALVWRGGAHRPLPQGGKSGSRLPYKKWKVASSCHSSSKNNHHMYISLSMAARLVSIRVLGHMRMQLAFLSQQVWRNFSVHICKELRDIRGSSLFGFFHGL